MGPRRQRRAGSPRVTLVVLVVGLTVGAWVVVTSPFFDIAGVQVEGNRQLSDGEIVALSGVGERAGLLTLSLHDVEERLLRSPWVAGVEASRILPDVLRLTVVERRPVGMLGSPAGFALVAGDGVVLRLDPVRAAGMPSLGTAERRPEVGGPAGVPAPVLRVAGSFDGRLRRRVQAVSLRGRQVRLTLDDDVTVLYGDATLLAQKNAALRGMLRYARREGIEVALLDVRAPASPVLRPAAASLSPASTPTPSVSPGG